MAITKEQIEYQIGANAKELSDALDQLKAKTLGLDAATNNLQGSTKDLSKTEKEYADAIAKANSSSANGSKIFEELNFTADQLNESMTATNSILQSMDLPEDQLRKFDQALNAVTNSVNLFKASLTIFSSVKAAIDAAFNPETIALANKLLYILQAYATIKGFDKLADSIETARNKLNLLSEAVDKFRYMTTQGLMETIDRTSMLSKAFLVVSATISTVTSVIAAAIVGLAGFSIFKTISQDGLNFAKIISGIGATFKGVFSGIADNIKNTGSTFAGLKLSLGDFYKALSISGLGLGSLASHLAENEIAALAFVSTLNFTSTAFIALSVAIKIVLHAIGSFIESIGDKLINAMDAFSEKFAKTQQVAVQFGFIIQNFGQAYGSNFIGTLSQWEEQIASLAKTSTFSSTDIRKATKIVVAENQALGLSYEENVKFLGRSVEIASSSGLELIDVVQRLQSALMGNSTAVGALGINLSSHALEHSKLNKTMQKTVGTMTSLEKQQIALAEIYRQTDPLVGAAIKQGETIIGINLQIANSYSAMQSKLGSVNVFSIELSKTYASLLKTVESLPDAFFAVFGGLTDLVGVTFKIVGITVQWLLIIGTLSKAYKILNAFLATNIALQAGINNIFAKLGINLALNVGAVNSVSAAFKALGFVFKTGFILLLGEVGKVLFAVTGKVLAFTAAILTSPVFLGGAAIVIVVLALVKALDELNKEFQVVQIALGDFSDYSQGLSTVFESLGSVLSGSFNAFVQALKIVILSMAELYHYAVIARFSLDKIFNPKGSEEYDKRIDASLEKLDTLTAAHEKSMDSIAFGFLGANEKVALHAKYLDEAGKSTDELTFKQLQLKKAADSIDMTTIKVDILGTEVEKITNKYTVAAREAAKFSKEILASTEVNTEAVKSYQKALEDQAGAGFQLDKVRIDSLKEISKIVLDVKNNSLKNNEDETKAIIAGFDERRDAVKEFEKAIVQTGPVSTDTAAKIIAAYDSIAKAQKIAIEAAKKKKEDEGIAETLKVYKEQYQALKDIQDKNIEIEKFNKSEGLTNREKIASDLAIELRLINEKLDLEKATWGETSKVSEELRKQKKLLIEQAEIRLKKSPSAKYEKLVEVGTDVGDGITRAFTDGASGLIAGAASIVGSMGTAIGAIVGAINTLLDFIPNLINSVAEIFNKITDFPETLFKAFQGLFDGVVRFVSDFIPKLVESVFKSFTQMNDFANNLANAVENLASQLPDIISNLIEKLPDMLVSQFENIGKAFVNILIAVMIKIPAAIIKGIIQGVSKLWEGIKRLFAGKSFLPKIKVDATDAAKKIGAQLSGASGRLFSVKDLTDAAKDPVKAMTDSIEESFKKGTDWIKQVWMWVYEKIIQPIFKGLKAVWMFVWDKIIQPIFEGLKAVWMFIWDKILKPVIDAYKAVFNWINDNIFKPIINAYKAVFNWINDNIFKPIIDAYKAVFNWINDNIFKPIIDAYKAVFNWINDNIFKPIIDGIRSVFVWVYDNVIGPIISVVMTAFQYVKDLFDGLAGIVQGAFQFVKDVFDQAVGLGSKIWEGLKNGIQQAGAIFGNIGTQIWESLKSGLSGIGNFLKNIFDKLDPSNLFAKIFKVDMGGKGTVEKALGIDIPFMSFASGGLVPGQAKIKGDSLQNDRILAMLSPGEAIIPRSKMDDPKVRALVDQILKGELELPQFAGGTLGAIVKGGGKAVSGVLQDLGDAGQAVIDQVSGAAQGAGDWLGDVFNNANPLKAMWEVVKDKVFNDMIMSMFKNNRFALGGPVPNMGTDTVPAMLTPGEFVMSRPAVQSIGLDNLRAMNNGSSLGGSNTYNMSFEINVEAKTSMDEGYIRGTLIPRMSEELKRASLDGKFVLSQKGIR